ncbi:hypothetical protein B1748_20080 [Paenibacillus sp. MY03]|jgi:hypothetical protein|uniref:hypothetical protein n=1 Tax=Paenibacillus sp. MY03 TaxID=302980 RepID=UPI000B3D1436|nr:hypothetical protein [Paenibacillus sp. MY03]OUS74879.1 hypothetical protein B1748_20080 [Paenibacillus sp. MY03]
MKKPGYKEALSKLKMSEDFRERTIAMLEREQHKMEADGTLKGEIRMNTVNTTKKNKWAAWSVGVAACAVLAVGIVAWGGNDGGNVPAPGTNNGVVDSQQPAPPSSGKAVVNIDGVIEEVAADGKSFRVGDLWVSVTDETEYGIPGPNAPEASEQLVSKEFKVGNAVSGFTSDDVASGKVTAQRIYNNF